MIVALTADATIGTSGTYVGGLDASSVLGDQASDFGINPANMNGPMGFLGSFSLSPPFTGVTSQTILSDISLSLSGSSATLYLYRVDGTTLATTFESSVLIPEPMTIALLGLGGLFLRRRR
jgi:hypothetical protein